MKDIISKEVDLSPIFVDVYCDTALQFITNYHHTRAMVNKGCAFAFILSCLLLDHPEIEERYPPGVLGFTLNGRVPEIDTPLNDGDKICFTIEIHSPFLGHAPRVLN